MIKNDRLIRACRRQKVDRAPVWMMRQAGRYMAEYRALRVKHDFMTMCKTPELAAEVSMQPYEILGVDAVIMFSDILVPVEAMGMKVDIIESKGPVLDDPIRTEAQVEKLIVPDPVETMPFVMETIRLLRKRLEHEAPLIGFAGAPFTLASYMVEGGGTRNYAEIKRMMYREPMTIHRLLDKLADTIILYINAQIEAGAQVVQLFDTWAGELSAADYEEFALPYERKIFERIHRGHSESAGPGVPAILYINGCSHILEKMAGSGADVLSVDWRIDLAEARRRAGDKVALQGNLDPCELLGTPESIARSVKEVLKKGGGLGHVMNLGHGILPMVPVENARAFIETAKAGIKDVA
ncbi:MAG TPA: uroporphyrinogen decarboxylase [Blastocatellia bacterium]|jgi:uroporphyrinogen decarboxylase|nr:uroporphyrinogen decarboxylase [Blastocatellia bacterium]